MGQLTCGSWELKPRSNEASHPAPLQDPPRCFSQYLRGRVRLSPASLMLYYNDMQRVSEKGFTLLELALVTFVVLVFGFLLLMQLLPERRGTHRIKCINNLKNVGLSFSIYATDNDERFPGSFLLSNRTSLASIQVTEIYASLSNELSTPLILYCDKDTARKPARSFTNFTSENISYFASLSATEDKPLSFLAGDRNLYTNHRLLSGVFGLTTNSRIAWAKSIHVEQGNMRRPMAACSK